MHLAALNVDDIRVGSDMLIITDEKAPRVSTGGGNDCTLIADTVLIEQGDGCVAFESNLLHIKACLSEVLNVAADDWV